MPDYRKLAATLADLSARAAALGRHRGDEDLQRLARRLEDYAHAMRQDLAGGGPVDERTAPGRLSHGLALASTRDPSAPDGR